MVGAAPWRRAQPLEETGNAQPGVGAGSETLPQDWTDSGTQCLSQAPQWERCLALVPRPLASPPPGPHESRLGTGEKGGQLKQGCIYPGWLPWGQVSGRREETEQGQLQERGPSSGAKLSLPVYPYLFTEDPGGMNAPLSRTEAEAMGPSFKASLGRLINYTCRYICAKYMCPRTTANG